MTSGRVLSRLVVWMAGAGLIGSMFWYREVRADGDRVAEIQAICEGECAYHTRAPLLRELLELDSTAAREALADLADHGDPKVATQAIAALGRAEYGGAKTKLAAIVADGNRSNHVRSMAATAHLRADKRGGVSEATAETRFSSTCSANAAVSAARDAACDKLWGGQ
jgi:hypothetical protein